MAAIVALCVFGRSRISQPSSTARGRATSRITSSHRDVLAFAFRTTQSQKLYFQAALKRSIDLADVHTIMIQQGCRPVEIFTLERISVNLENRSFTITHVEVPARGITCKSKASRRTLRMTDDVLRIFRRRMESSKGRWLFESSRKPGTPILTLQKAHEDVIRATGMTGFRCTIYDHRHTFATRAARTCNPWDLARLLGHSDLNMLDKYVHPSQADMDNAMLALSAGMATKFTEMLVDFEGKNWPTQDQFGGPGKKSK